MKSLCFEDEDFLSGSLELFVTLYLRDPLFKETFFPDVDLEDYVDLMPADLRELYFDKKKELEKIMLKNTLQNEKVDYSDKNLLNDIIKACAYLQGIYIYKTASENARNSQVAATLELSGYTVKDQTLWGESNGGKAPGEIDIFVRHTSGKPLSIIEAFNLKSFNKSYIDTHLKKVFKYDTNGLKDNFILVYSSDKSFYRLWNKYIKYIPTIQYPNDFVEFVEESEIIGLAEIKVGKSTHLRNNKEVYLHHIFVNLA